MPMDPRPAMLLRDARLRVGLSRRALAALAEVPTSTVSRIEAGQTDPSFGTLSLLLAAAGTRLVLSAVPNDDSPPSLATLASAIRPAAGRHIIDWTRLRAFADWARLNPDDVTTAIADPPKRTDTPLDAILAGFAELLAERAGVDKPRWTRTVPWPENEWTAPATPAMVDRARIATPDPLRRRNIVLARSELFREADEVTA